MYNSLSLFQTQSTPSVANPPIIVSFGDTQIHTITGPVPFVDFSKTFNFNGNGIVETITHNITLTGKIVRAPFDSSITGCANPSPIPAGSGIKGIVEAIKLLESKLNNCPVGVFQIKCGNAGDSTVLYEASGVKVASYQIDKSENNWVRYADYTIAFEYTTNADPNAPLVQDMSDNWNIEPLDDIMYEDFTLPVQQRGEWSNPQLKPTAPSNGSVIPAGNINNGPGTTFTNNGTLRVVSLPQFRITRSLGCKGLPVQSSGNGSGICFTGTGANINNITKYNNTAFSSAKKWVEQELAKSYNGSQWKASGILYFLDSPSVSSFNNGSLFLYNHARTTSIDIYNGTYEVNETWLAMPTGINYIEEYNIDMSTGEDYSKTVRVAGNIRGLSIANMGLMAGTGSVAPNAVPPIQGATFDGKISLSGFMKKPETGTMSSIILDNAGSTVSQSTILNASKYQNALSGWLYSIKPYLYRRACLATNSPDRTQQYIPLSNASADKSRPPNNPIYCVEGLLNPVPKSTTEGHDPRKGTISYSYEYSNSSMIISGVISENITITNDAPSDVVNETQVIGRSLGPIMTKTGKSSPRKSISIEIVVPKPTKPSEMWMVNPDCPLWTGGYLYNFIDKIIEGVKPFGKADTGFNYVWGNQYVSNNNSQLNPRSRAGLRPGIVFVSSDQDNWNPTSGRYSRSVSWTYQQCGNDTNYLDH